ncbi:hypothetical protein [Sorangium sp. So ce1099]|uniref:hypothetical protein n=1 Tax=Sorangium sp. So ce1099 TaxID=3133331 RepID=UPI003F5F97CA
MTGESAAHAGEKAAFFRPENEREGSRRQFLSPKGKYRLVVSSFSTGRGAWDYSQGKVYKTGSDAPIAVVQRNHDSFPFLFVEGHPNGHDYLVCGEDYQGQSVLELDTGKRRDHLPDEANEGIGFCWTDMRFEASAAVLVVEGCIWACPYEFRFFDFSDPMSGWPELESATMVDADRRPPTFSDDGTIICYQSASDDDDADADATAAPIVEAPIAEPPIAATQTFRRDGLKLVLEREWVSEKERARRRAQEEGRKRHEAWLAGFRASDPLYLTFIQALSDPAFSPEDHDGIGVTYDGWCPDFTAQERRITRRIVKKKGPSGYTIDLEWGAETGPVKLVVYKDGDHAENRFFEHSVVGMRDALAHAKSLLSGDAGAAGA